jgi:hypothetical protein
MKAELERIGITDTPENRILLDDHFRRLINDDSNIVKQELMTFNTGDSVLPSDSFLGIFRESFFMGPYGGVRFTSIWEGNILRTVIIEAGAK